MERVAIINGCRTPFTKAGTSLAKYSAVDLGLHALNSLIKKCNISSVDEVIFSSVLLNPRYPNLARELVFRSALPNTTPAHFISNNCISGLVAVNFIADGIRSGRIKSGIAGGVESMSQPTLTLKESAEKWFVNFVKERKVLGKVNKLLKYKPSYLMPEPPSPKEPSTGLTMGEHCELMAKEFQIPRTEQDLIAMRSHLNAARAAINDYLAAEISPLGDNSTDNLIRSNTTLEKLAKLKPVFDKSSLGTLTAGNSSALTDGASAIYLMAESEAKRLNLPIKGYIEEVTFSAIDPSEGLLMAPALAVANLMNKRSLTVQDIDCFEMHEAFGAQVAANLKVLELGWTKHPEMLPIGKIPEEKLNINGGSLAIGHPFAATGGRLILSCVNHLERNQLKQGLISVCAAGAMGCAMLITRD